MKCTHPTVTSRANRVMIESESLESRRLFSGMPGDPSPHGHYGPPPGPPPGPAEYEAMAAVYAVLQSLPFGGVMRVASDGTTTTATSTMNDPASASISGTPVANAPPANRVSLRAGEPQSVQVRVIAAAADRTNVDVRMASGSAVLTKTDDDAPAAFAVATAATGSTAASNPSVGAARADADLGVVFGPFTLGSVSTQSRNGDGLGSLLSSKPDAVDKSLRWQAQDATIRPRRNPTPETASADERLNVDISADVAGVQQASLGGLPADAAIRPLWQRVAVATAGMTLVAANWVVRRRQRRSTPALRR